MTDGNLNPLIIPHRSLQPDTLKAMLEDFVTRDGTDYGEAESPLAQRVERVLQQLRSGTAVIVYDSAAETFTILPKDQVRGV